MEHCGYQGHRFVQKCQISLTFGPAQRPHVTIDETRDHEGIDRRDGRGFRWRKDTTIDATKDDHDQKQPPGRFTT